MALVYFHSVEESKRSILKVFTEEIVESLTRNFDNVKIEQFRSVRINFIPKKGYFGTFVSSVLNSDINFKVIS